MLKKFIICFHLVVFGYLIVACTFVGDIAKAPNHKNTNLSVKRVGDFEVRIEADNVMESTKMKASITYVGEEESVTIQHGGRVFYHGFEELNGEMSYGSPMNLPLLTTTLVKNKPYVEELSVFRSHINRMKMGKTYKFWASASFSSVAEEYLEERIDVSQNIKKTSTKGHLVNGDFEISINADYALKTGKVKATITYIGKDKEKYIYHGGDIFSFGYNSVIDTKASSVIREPIIHTRLLPNKPHVVTYPFVYKEMKKLKADHEYVFWAEANFYLDNNSPPGTGKTSRVEEVVLTPPKNVTKRTF